MAPSKREAPTRFPLRVGLVGLGGVADAHLAAYRGSESVEVVAGAEPQSDRLAEVAKREKIRPYRDCESMLEADTLDLVCVTASVNAHREIVETVARAGLPVLCEKPLAVTVEDGEAILKACRSANVPLCYGASYRFLPAVCRAKEILEEGRIGDVMLLTESAIGGSGLEGHQAMGFHHYPPGGPGGGGMGLVDHGIHLLDLFPWLLDSEIVSVFGAGNISGEPPGTEFAQMELACGATGHLLYNDATFGTELPSEGQFSWGGAWDFTGYVPPGGWLPHPGSIQVYGTRGALRIFHYANRLFMITEAGIEQVRVEDRPPPGHFAAQVESFAEGIVGGHAPAVSGEDGLRALKALHAIYESARTGKRVRFGVR